MSINYLNLETNGLQTKKNSAIIFGIVRKFYNYIETIG